MNHNGVYSLKSGYKLILELEDTETPIVTESVAKKDVWKKTWHLHVLNRIRTLLWRACSDSLPTRVNLARRKIIHDNTYHICLLEPETTTHALWSCLKLASVWLPQFAKLKEATSSLCLHRDCQLSPARS